MDRSTGAPPAWSPRFMTVPFGSSDDTLASPLAGAPERNLHTAQLSYRDTRVDIWSLMAREECFLHGIRVVRSSPWSSRVGRGVYESRSVFNCSMSPVVFADLSVQTYKIHQSTEIITASATRLRFLHNRLLAVVVVSCTCDPARRRACGRGVGGRGSGDGHGVVGDSVSGVVCRAVSR